MSKFNSWTECRKKPSALEFREIVKREADRELPNINSWFDMWHKHVDWNGDGALSRAHRQFELWALFRVLRTIEKNTLRIGKRYQVFAYVYERDPGGDAVYIHTENPNGTPFPYEPTVDCWLHELPFWLSRHVSLETHSVAQCTYDGERSYFVGRKQDASFSTENKNDKVL